MKLDCLFGIHEWKKEKLTVTNELDPRILCFVMNECKNCGTRKINAESVDISRE